MKLYYLNGKKSQFLLQHGELPEGFEHELEVNGYEELVDEVEIQRVLRAFVSDDVTTPEMEDEVEVGEEEDNIDDILSDMKFHELRSYAKELGVNFGLTTKRPDLERLVKKKLAE